MRQRDGEEILPNVPRAILLTQLEGVAPGHSSGEIEIPSWINVDEASQKLEDHTEVEPQAPQL